VTVNPTVRICFSLAEAEPFYTELERAGVATAFQRLIWLRLWQCELAPSRGAAPIFVLVAESDGRPLMLLPLCRRRHWLLRVIEAADLGVSDYAAPVMASHFHPSREEWCLLWARIRAVLPRHDVLRLTKIPCEFHGRPNPLAWIKGARPLDVKAFGLPIYAPWDAFAVAVLSRSRRQDLKRNWRRLSEQGVVRFRVVEHEDEAESLFATLVAQRITRFKLLGRREPLEDPAFRAFYAAVAREGTRAGFARIAVLEVEGEVVAIMLGLLHAGAFHIILLTFMGEAWTRFSPGLLLIARTMEWAAENGLTYFDFTIGDEPYKQELGGRPLELVEVVQAGSLSGVPAVGSGRLLARLKAKIKGNAKVRAALVRAREQFYKARYGSRKHL
jgi:CelD/BcsL family acetyltransferase involved in cellulose biosynthesis